MDDHGTGTTPPFWADYQFNPIALLTEGVHTPEYRLWEQQPSSPGRRTVVNVLTSSMFMREAPLVPKIQQRFWDLVEKSPSVDWVLMITDPRFITEQVPERWLVGDEKRYGKPAVEFPSNVRIGVQVNERVGTADAYILAQETASSTLVFEVEHGTKMSDITAVFAWGFSQVICDIPANEMGSHWSARLSGACEVAGISLVIPDDLDAVADGPVAEHTLHHRVDDGESVWRLECSGHSPGDCLMRQWWDDPDEEVSTETLTGWWPENAFPAPVNIHFEGTDYQCPVSCPTVTYAGNKT